ncbi:MAG: Rieske (2Fe-2S) protein [Gammaproteobacteria bacterium]
MESDPPKSNGERWLKLCELDDLCRGRTNLVEVEGSFLYVSGDEKNVRAFDATCPHHASNLSFAPIRDGLVECPLHGWQFEVTTGRCIRGGRDLIEHQTKVEDDIVYGLFFADE